MQSLGRCLPSECFTGPAVEGGSNRVELALGVSADVGAFGWLSARTWICWRSSGMTSAMGFSLSTRSLMTSTNSQNPTITMPILLSTTMKSERTLIVPCRLLAVADPRPATNGGGFSFCRSCPTYTCSGNNPGIHREASAAGKASRSGARVLADVRTPRSRRAETTRRA